MTIPKRCVPILGALLALFPALGLFAQEESRKIAVASLWGENAAMTQMFEQELFSALFLMEGVEPLRMADGVSNRDIPAEGFPPFVSPSLSQTGGAPYALTGNVQLNPITGQWHMRLFLWQMSDSRLLFSDEIAASDRQTVAAILPFMLEWLFFWIPGDNPASQYLTNQGNGVWNAQGFPRRPLKNEYPVIIGLRAGVSPWTSRSPGHVPFNAALSLYLPDVLGCPWFFGVQGEAIFMADFTKDTISLMFPFMARFTTRSTSSFLSMMLGGYFFLPEITSELRPENSLGYMTGFSLGTRLGPGWAFFDIRWSQDLPSLTNGLVTVSLGYEFGLFRRSR